LPMRKVKRRHLFVDALTCVLPLNSLIIMPSGLCVNPLLRLPSQTLLLLVLAI
jgi:hypothetical protein